MEKQKEVIHSVHKGDITQVHLGGVSNMQITNGEKEDIGYFVAGSGVWMTPKCEKWKTKGRVQRTTFTCLIILLIFFFFF